MPCSVKFSRNGKRLVSCTIGLHPGMYVGAYGRDPADALHAAASVAAQMDAVIKRNPELAAIIPPQATAAFAAISLASKAVKSGMPIEQVAATAGVQAARAVKKLLRTIF